MPNQSGIWSLSQQFQARGQGLWPTAPGAPTSVSATAGTSLCASVAFTAPACAGYPTPITSYTVTSTPGCKTGTGSSSPILVSGLTDKTSYTFKVKATNGTGTGPCSSASNSITAQIITCALYNTPGTYSWVAPSGVTSVSVVAVGGGAAATGSISGGGGGLGYKNGYAVTPGSSYTVVVGNTSQNSYFVSTGTVRGGGASGSSGGSYTGDGGGNGGSGGSGSYTGGGGAGGYSGSGGSGSSNCAGGSGSGGGGGGGGAGRCVYYIGCFCGVQYFAGGGGGGGGGVGLYGQGTSGAGGARWNTANQDAGGYGGKGGSGGSNGGTGYSYCGLVNSYTGGNGGSYGGGGGNGYFVTTASIGAVRLVWAGGSRGTPSFPSTNVGP